MIDLHLQWKERASAVRRRILLADEGDHRAHEAAARLNDEGLADAQVVDASSDFVDDDVREAAEQAGPSVDLSDPLHVATLLVAMGRAHACVAGATRPTADVIRAGIRILGVAEGVRSISSSFFFVLTDGRPVVYGDCGVLPDPDSDELASVAVSSARTFSELADDEARVAMLSFSTKGSAEHPRVHKVRDATAKALEMAPELLLDGELQFDAAWVDTIASSKAPDSLVAGRANVFIFPNLDAGNIAYKITERIGGAQAFGPLLQGLGGLLHDLSRGCTAHDIFNVSLIASLQSSTIEPT